MSKDRMMIKGTLHWKLTNEDGSVAGEGTVENLITQVGDQLYGERAAGVASPPAAPTGMKLGTGGTAPSKTGAGAALVTYLTDSHLALGSAPASALSGSARRITYQCVFAAGKATSGSPITEAVLVNDATLTNATSSAANTIARALITGIAAKASGQALTVTWTHDLLGA